MSPAEQWAKSTARDIDIEHISILVFPLFVRYFMPIIPRLVTLSMVMKEFAWDEATAQKFIDLGIQKGWVIPRGENIYEVMSQRIIAKAEAIVHARKETM